jgi:hypothetical protein
MMPYSIPCKWFATGFLVSLKFTILCAVSLPFYHFIPGLVNRSFYKIQGQLTPWMAVEHTNIVWNMNVNYKRISPHHFRYRSKTRGNGGDNIDGAEKEVK